MSTLYELTATRELLLSKVEELDEQAFYDTLDSIDEAIELKVENTAKMIREIEGKSLVIADEIKRLQAKKQTLDNRTKGMKEYIQQSMEATGIQKVEGTLLNVTIQKNPVSVRVIDEETIPLSFFVEQKPKLDKQALKDELKNGLELPGAELVQTESLRIR